MGIFNEKKIFFVFQHCLSSPPAHNPSGFSLSEKEPKVREELRNFMP